MQIYLWKDRHDGDMIQLGDKRKDGTFICWGQMHIDGVVHTFGEPVRRELDRRTLLSVSNNHAEAPVLVEAIGLIVNGDLVEATASA